MPTELTVAKSIALAFRYQVPPLAVTQLSLAF